jgi:hypothetical protein
VGDVPVAHTLPLQHPPHDALSQTHAPPAQRWPAAQTGPSPQWHAPEAQVSARTGSHVVHEPPVGPHVAAPGAAHTSSASQQPVVHDIASHTHEPDAHRCPGRHAGPLPHAQLPAPEHASASDGSHSKQLPPPMPQ